MDKPSTVSSIIVGLGSGIVGSALTQIVTVIVQRLKDQANARYIAIRVAVILEEYALSCFDLITMWDEFCGSGQNVGAAPSRIPDLPDYPDDGGWQTLNASLMERALTLRNQVTIGRREVVALADIADDADDIHEHLAGHAGFCGYQAWRLAEDLRNVCKFEKFDPKQTSADIVPTLKKRHDKILQEQIALHSGRPVSKPDFKSR